MSSRLRSKRELERDYAALFDVDDDELTLATEQDEDEDARALWIDSLFLCFCLA